MTKLTSVTVSWKYTETQKDLQTQINQTKFNVNFPAITYEKEDLNNRKQWSDQQWINLALNDFEGIKGFRPEFIQDECVERKYDSN